MAKSSSEKPSGENDRAAEVDRKKRNKLQKVYLNLDEVAIIDRKRGRLSKSEYLRDRALFNDGHYEPSIAAIGGVYQASGAVIRAARELSDRESQLRDIEDDYLTLMCGGSSDQEAARMIVDAVRKQSLKLFDAARTLADLGASLQREAKIMGSDHILHLRDRHPIPTIKIRERKRS